MAKKAKADVMTAEDMFNALPDNCRNDAMREICGMFVESRMEMGFPFTKRALTIVLNKYEWTADMLAASLLCATERGWRGVFLPSGQTFSEYAEAYHRMLLKIEEGKRQEAGATVQEQQAAPQKEKSVFWWLNLTPEERKEFMQTANQ